MSGQLERYRTRPGDDATRLADDVAAAASCSTRPADASSSNKSKIARRRRAAGSCAQQF